MLSCITKKHPIESPEEEGREDAFSLIGLGEGAKLKFNKLSSHDAFL